MRDEAVSMGGHRLDTDYLRSTGAKPAWFGLGFIQIKLDPVWRMHFWHPALAADVAEEELHDHRYDFESRVLHGETTHEVYDFIPDDGGDHGLFEVSCKPGETAEPTRVGVGRAGEAGSYTMVKGSRYSFPHRQFHRIKATECVTLVARREIMKDRALVLKPLDAGHACPFERTIPEDELWDYIDELARDRVRAPGSGYHLKPIPKGVVGEPTKIVEEMAEFLDALKQDNPVMALVELSDQIAAIGQWLARHHPSITVADLATMGEATVRAFENGHRS